MKKQRVTLFSMVVVAFVLIIGTMGLLAEESESSMYAHISYVDGTATVMRQDNTEQNAVVNLPIVPGDQIFTPEKGRVELQFDNGTVVRLDKDSRLKVTTVTAPSLTSNWKITTLHLMRGALSTITQTYSKEMFQIITPNAAVEMKRRTTAYIKLEENGDTKVFAERGKFEIMYGKGVYDLKTEVIKNDKGFLITADHKMEPLEGKRDVDFIAWNEYVNRNFKDLHYGVSKVPKKIYRFNKGLVYWAEKWSSLYGEWIYDDLYGYVWKPADELFSFSRRPFFNANFVRVNGQLFIVPQQSWGWAPAHMGTWVWDTKRGWTWIPGNTFNSGFYYDPFWRFSAQYAGMCCYPTLEYWMWNSYGGYDMYYLYRTSGIHAWRDTYQKRFNTYKKSPISQEVPKSVREVLAKLDKTPVETVKSRLGAEMRTPVIEMEKIRSLFKSGNPDFMNKLSKKAVEPTVKVKSNKIVDSNLIVRDVNTVQKDSGETNMRSLKGKISGRGIRVLPENFRDFNPDSQWAVKKGFKIVYSSRNNEIVCPNLGLSSKTISRAQKDALIGRSSVFSRRGQYASSASSSTVSGTSTSDSAVISAPRSGTRVGSSGQTAGPGSATAKDK